MGLNPQSVGLDESTLTPGPLGGDEFYNGNDKVYCVWKLRTVLTNRVLRFLHDKSTKSPEEYDKFYKDYGMFLKEGIVTTNEQMEKEEIAKLLRFESSLSSEGEKVSLPQYCSRLKPGQRDVFYLAAPSRALAESSPYFEALKKKEVEVLFCYEPYDELVLMQLRQFDSRNLTSVEKEMRQDKEPDDLTDLGYEGKGNDTGYIRTLKGISTRLFVAARELTLDDEKFLSMYRMTKRTFQEFGQLLPTPFLLNLFVNIPPI
ncbi:hypothetical protein ANN_03606 [Periplaneta americana]|uniref:Uncharacterized protein n=1 Tax=Periplaneta americana TaxID=6978 RepID=A0ABQ8U3T4_PERAM|nr:hypothetical protein ANN_03606 [Periplaneta americana]